jgi:hypothetical protein
MRNLVLMSAVTFFLAGCLEFDILVKVNPDGNYGPDAVAGKNL